MDDAALQLAKLGQLFLDDTVKSRITGDCHVRFCEKLGGRLSNTPNGADASAMLYSIIETAKVSGLILCDYMVKCMKELAKAKPDIDALLPWNFNH
ncbi:hypothetical protein H735_28420 [Vibrio owensii CAIM 1854 = LMG 25443]|uniref:Transposase n=1 Tax=Vibrio owensii CAIM 1854 = LMG 25443 TaxID=1229493 RepID=A0A0C1VB14_9VIBR|nr:hypothetical protein H735_28420 [Vibrio owensii CAIM 1854 = LMG 25443]